MTTVNTPRENNSFALALRLARRELRAGLHGFRIFLACLILGVAAIAGIGSLTASLSQGLQAEGQTLLGGDIEIRTFRRAAGEEELAHIQSMGEVAYSLRLRAMTRAVESDLRTLTEIKAVDSLYPLYGNLELNPPSEQAVILDRRDGVWGAAIPQSLAERLVAEVGSLIEIGDATFEVRAILVTEPDRSNEGLQWGPSVLISWDAIEEMNLLRLGSLFYYHYKIRIPDTADLEVILDDLNEAFPENDWRVRDRTNSAPGIRNFVDMMGMFLTLVGLSALTVGGVGVGNAVRNYLDSKTETIATFKILGASSALVFKIYLIQVMALAFVSVVLGLLVGVFAPLAVGAFLPGEIPVAAEMGIYPMPLILAALYGILITLIFAVWPLAKARDIPAAKLFRTIVAPSHKWPRKRYIFLMIFSVVAIISLAIGLADGRMLASGFVAGAIVSFLALRGLGALIQKVASKLPRPRKPGLRLALANLHRPGAATGAVVLSLGLGLTIFATITLVEGNLSQQVESNLPDEVPAFFMLDIQGYERDAFRETVESMNGVNELNLIPSLRGQVLTIDGQDVDEMEFPPEAPRWVLRERNLTYSEEIPLGNEISDGEWWPADYDGPALISFAKREAEGLGIGVGTRLKLNVLGREIEAEIANLRDFDWDGRGFNFVMVFSPGVLEQAPHHYMASLKVDVAEEGNVYRSITDQFPNVTSIRVREMLETVNHMLSQIGTAVRAMALIAILAGVLVLAGAMAAGQRHRVYDAVIMKILGAVRSDIIKAYVVEYLALGLITGVVAIGLGTAAGYLVVTEAMNLNYVFMPAAMAQTVLASLLFTVGFGLVGTFRALGAKPVEVLRAN